MEASARPPVVAKRLWHIVRVVYFMLRKGISKRKLMMDLHLMMKRGKIAGKAIGNLMFHHHSSFSCRSQDPHLAYFAPREYEFSCSNSPAFPLFHLSKRSKNHHAHSYSHHHHHHNYFSCIHPSSVEDEVAVSALQKTLEMLNSEKSAAASPMPVSWFGRSPATRTVTVYHFLSLLAFLAPPEFSAKKTELLTPQYAKLINSALRHPSTIDQHPASDPREREE
ncbi:hypothetical protein H6P81_009091 [Aristolochia fimbriata]|uniref:Uncharacterized protein n=1 Tax=Aristolochia fimbriata TaxID=158543 RepID=A0AAV7EML5_ARIFI|nr:hypothetical protein H6P81_009091 [Aristolochia fimbriata]